MSKRNPAVLGQWGKGKPRVLAKNWADPVRWSQRTEDLRRCAGCGRIGALETWHEDIVRKQPTAIACCPDNAPRRFKQTVFPSLCDWLDDEVPAEWLFNFLELVLRKTEKLNWLLLTKRPELFEKRLRAAAAQCTVDPLDVTDLIYAWIEGSRIPLNVWIGTSVEDQPNADRRIPALLKIPAAGRFLSLEPLLGPVELGFPSGSSTDGVQFPDGFNEWPEDRRSEWFKSMARATYIARCEIGIHWLIIGGESGLGARPCNVEWIRSLVAQGRGAGVATFVKQLGAYPVGRWTKSPQESGLGYGWPAGMKITHPKGGDPAEWPEDVRVREYPEGLR